jgi:ribonuclease Z
MMSSSRSGGLAGAVLLASLAGGSILAAGACVAEATVSESSEVATSAQDAEGPLRYRFTRGPGVTPGGNPLPLSGTVMADPSATLVRDGATARAYPEFYIPGQEPLAEDEMRISICGSGNPPVRQGQGATCILVELGNGDNFVFDVGGGTVPNLWALGPAPTRLDKLFLTHLHLDHVGGILTLFDALGWSRNTPLHVWGSSGLTPELGTAAMVAHLQQAARWHTESKRGIVPSGGMEMVAHEFDYGQFSPENPRQLVYDDNGVHIYAFPILHILVGSVGYRLEWNGLSMAFTGDSEPTTQEAEQAAGVDVFIHEVFIPPEPFAEKNNMPLSVAENIVYQAHTPPDMLGRVFDIARPVLGVGTHYFQDDDLIDVFFEGIRTTYDGPIALTQDRMVFNVSPESIVMRMAKTEQLWWAPSDPEAEGGDTIEEGYVSPARTPDWIVATKIGGGG